MPDNSLAPKKANQNSSNQIKDQETLEQLSRVYKDIIVHDNIREAFKFSQGIETKITQTKLADTDKELFNKYYNIVIKLKWVALPWLNNQEAIELFKNHFTIIFEIEFFNVWEKLKKKLLTLILLEPRDELKQKTKQALLANQEKITSQKLSNGELPTIANWLKDYTSKLGSSPVNKTKQTEYLVNSENIRGLSEEEINKLKILFNVFEKTKLSSFTVEGIEEAIPVDEPGNEGEIIEGRFEKYRDKETIINGLKRMQAIIKGKKPDSSIVSQVTTTVTDLNQITANIVSSSGLNLKDLILQKRFENLVLSFLKEIRNLTQAQDILERSTKVGGLELSKDQTQKVLTILKLEKRKLEESRKIKGEKPVTNLEKLIQGEAGASFIIKQSQLQKSKPSTPLRPGKAKKPENNLQQPTMSYNKLQQVTRPRPQAGEQVTTSYHQLREADPEQRRGGGGQVTTSYQKLQPQGLGALVPQKPISTPIKIQEIKPPTPKIPSRPAQTFNSPLYTTNLPVLPVSKKPPSSFARPQLESIRQPSRLIGGVEEIGSLRLVDFRRWSTDANESAARIKDKIDALEEQSIEKKAQAISAWQNSEINRLYLDIGRESLESNNPIEVVIKKREAENKPTLSLTEFEAIADLNRELNF